MIKVNFYRSESMITAFDVDGHAMYDEYGKDIVCAFVSSACLMTANTITEVMGIRAEAMANDGSMKLQILDSPNKAQDILNGLLLHLQSLANDYPKNVKVIISEV